METATGPLFNVVSILAGVVVSFAVSALKKWEFIGKYPKLFGALLSAAIMIAGELTGLVPGGVIAIAVNSLTTLAAAVATYEIASKPVAEQIAESKITQFGLDDIPRRPLSGGEFDDDLDQKS